MHSIAHKLIIAAEVTLKKSTFFMESYNPEPLKWRPFTANEIEGLELPEPMREKNYILDITVNEDLEVPPIHITEDIWRLEDFCVNKSELSDDARRSGLDPSTGIGRLQLTSEQWQSLRQLGQINVPSRSFPGQKHTWQLARCVYSGTETIHADFKSGVGASLDQLLYVGDSLSLSKLPNEAERGLSRSISLFSGLKMLSIAVATLIDGCTQFVRPFRINLYDEALIDILVAEAKESYIKKRVFEIHNVTLPLSMDREDGLHYFSSRFTYKNDLWKALQTHGGWTESEPPSEEAFSIASSSYDQYLILKTKQEDYRPSQTSTIEKEISASLSPLATKRLQDEINDSAKNEKHQNWIELLLTNKIHGKHEAEAYEANLIQNDLALADDKEAQQIAEAKVSEEKNWMLCSKLYHLRRVCKIKHLEKVRLGTTFHDRLVDRLKTRNLKIEATKKELSMEFDTLHGPRLRQKLKSNKVSPAPAQFQVLQFDPANWKPKGSSYDRRKQVDVDLGKQLWRIRYSFVLCWSTFKEVVGGSLHFLLHGPLSLRALISESPYQSITQPTPDPSTLTSTYRSRLRILFEVLSDQRRKFENEPDFGVVPKSITRLFFRCKQFTKAFVGITFISTYMFVGTLISSLFCMVWVAGSPVIAMLWTTVVLIFQLLIFDTALSKSSAKSVKNLVSQTYPSLNTAAPFMKVAVVVPIQSLLAILRISLATLRALVLHPIAFVVSFAFSNARSIIRYTRDSLTWLILQGFAQVPATSEDTWIAYRVLGPGVSSEFYSRIPLNAAKLAVLRSLDCARLSWHKKLREIEFDAPYKDYVAMFNVSKYGIRTEAICNPPSAEVSKYVCKALREMQLSFHGVKYNPFLKGTDVQSGWDTLSVALLEQDPMNRTNVERFESEMRKEYEYDLAERARAILPQSALLKKIVDEINSKKTPTSPLETLVYGTMLVMARWLFVVESSRSILEEMVLVPDAVNGKFRMYEEEVESLWQFTLAVVEEFQTKLKEEMESIALSSEWIKDDSLDLLIQEATNKSVAVRSFQLLVSLFGIASLTETLEELDKSFVFEKEIMPTKLQ